MPFRSVVLTIVCLLLGSPYAIGAQDPLTLTMEECIAKGLRDNPQLKALRREIRASEYGVDAAKGGLGPSMTANYRYLRQEHDTPLAGMAQDDWMLNLNLHQPLFTGFRLLSNLEKSRLARDVATARLEQASQAFILNVQRTFLTLLQARENVRSAKDSLTRLKSQLKVITAYYEVGLRPKLDVLQAEVDVARAEQQLLAAQIAVRVQMSRLNSLLDIPVQKDVNYVGALEFIPFIRDLQHCLDTSLAHRPDMKIAAKSIAMAQKNAQMVASGFYPQLAADVDYYSHGDEPDAYGNDIVDEQNNDYWTARVTLSYKFFESGANYHAWKQAREKIAALEHDYTDLQNEISFQVKSSYDTLKESIERIEVTRKALTSARESFRMAKARYEAQVGTNTDVLDAQANVTQAEADKTQALADYQQALAALYNAMGVRNINLQPR
ncbi:outer membrane efflux protein [Desulfoplanes formicivorans]|uniref:Outer membrane efflux protein n=2 Tax=Desulfoplanes formicivorans TaxID=1592317 RepID=A0A194AGJ0_9BACT|nr:outer membrane efflux protein [Desulfoplanes formicivorans]